MFENRYQVFDGKHSSKVVAYCWKHKKFMTVKQMRKRNCLKRDCGAIRKVPQHPFWTQPRCATRVETNNRAKVRVLEFAERLQ